MSHFIPGTSRISPWPTRETVAKRYPGSMYDTNEPVLLSGDNAIHNGPLNAAPAAVAALIEQEAAEQEPGPNAAMIYLGNAESSLFGFARSEGYERSDDSGTIQAGADPYLVRKGSMNGLIYKTAKTQSVDEAEGVVVAAINTMNTEDLQKDIMVSGCWADVIKSFKTGKTK